MDYSQDPLALLANLCQVASFNMNVSEVSNDQIMKKLERQDLVIDEQTNTYLVEIIKKLDIIVKQNEEILDMMRLPEKNH